MRQSAKFFIPLIIVTIFLGTTSCNKDDDDSSSSTTKYMEGSLLYDLPVYIIASGEIHLIASGITKPIEGITYKWTATDFSIDTIYGQDVIINAPSVVGNYTVTCLASHKDYSSRSNTKSITVIDPSSPESFSGVVNGTKSIVDVRDGQIYYYNTIGDTDWFTSNLNWAGAGEPYYNASALTYIFGRLYSWTEATGGVSSKIAGGGPQGICPAGWSVPTEKDWESLAKNLNGGASLPFDSNWPGLGGKVTVNAKLNSNNIWKYSPNNAKDNLYSWNALPGGNISNKSSKYENLNQYGFWWSSTERDSDNAEYRYIHFDSSDFPYYFANKNHFGASVRCVRSSNK